LFGQELPRNDVRVVLHLGDEDLVAGFERAPAVALRHQVHALGGAAREDDLVHVGSV
jgi:hypothetical protein